MKNLKWFTVASWTLLVIAVGSFISVYLFPTRIPMSALVLFGGVGAAFLSALVLIIGLALTRAEIHDSWRRWAIASLVISIISSVTLAGVIVYALLHLPVCYSFLQRTKQMPDKSLQAKWNGAFCSALRFTSFAPARLSSGR